MDDSQRYGRAGEDYSNRALYGTPNGKTTSDQEAATGDIVYAATSPLVDTSPTVGQVVTNWVTLRLVGRPSSDGLSAQYPGELAG